MKRFDRWERAARRMAGIEGGAIAEEDAAKLLQREHAWAVRELKKMLQESWGMQAADCFVNGYQHGCEAMLSKLQERAL